MTFSKLERQNIFSYFMVLKLFCSVPTKTLRKAMIKGPVKSIQRVKIAHSFLHVVSKLFHFCHFKFVLVVLDMAAK